MTRFTELAKFINDMKPTALEPLAAILSDDDMNKLCVLDSLGWFMRCNDTGRIFCPKFCARG